MKFSIKFSTLLLFVLLVFGPSGKAQPAEDKRAQNWLSLQKLVLKKSLASWSLTLADVKQLRVLSGMSAFTQCTVGTVSCAASTLPVTGLVLKGQRTNADKVLLKWETLAEYNSKGFILERQSFNNINVFDSIFYAVAAGISYSKSKYEHTDLNSFSGNSYYRIKQTDRDGNYTYSNVVEIAGFQGDFAVNIAPNPATNRNIRFNFTIPPPAQTIDFTIANAAGVPLIKKEKFAAVNGYYELKNNTFPPGYYFITVHTSKGVITKSFVIAE